MPERRTGRHRAPGRPHPVSELSTFVGHRARPVAKAAAVLAVSGGMVATLGLPANATVSAMPVAPAAWPTAVELDRAETLAPAAVTAPAAGTSVAAPAFGQVGFTAVRKKVTLPRVDLVSRVVQPPVRATTATRSSRSTDRSPLVQRRVSVAPAASGVLGIAASLVGIYYVWGGTTPAGFDCSGFTSYVFRQVGIILPRTAAAQQAAATRVSNPQPGDLVFSGYPATHVGIYAGNGMMYDSPRTGFMTSLRRIYSSNVSYGRP